MKRYDPELSGPCPGLMSATMEESSDGEYVLLADVESHYSSAVSLIAAERERQLQVEGWDQSHDDNHIFDELAIAAACYAMPPSISARTKHWPWDCGWWKPSPEDRIRELVKAGALIVAEIDRLQRLRN